MAMFNEHMLSEAGFEFNPSDDKLIVNYLLRKINNQKLPCDYIGEFPVYIYPPEYLSGKVYRCKTAEENCYFFTKKVKKHGPTGRNTNRIVLDQYGTQIGYWKVTSSRSDVERGGVKVGSRDVLSYYTGVPSDKDNRTQWTMHEFMVDDENMEWVLCKIHKTTYKTAAMKRRATSGESLRASNHDDVVHTNVSNKIRKISSEESITNCVYSDPQHLNIHTDSCFPNPTTMTTPIRGENSAAYMDLGSLFASCGKNQFHQIPIMHTSTYGKKAVYRDQFFDQNVLSVANTQTTFFPTTHQLNIEATDKWRTKDGGLESLSYELSRSPAHSGGGVFGLPATDHMTFRTSELHECGLII